MIGLNFGKKLSIDKVISLSKQADALGYHSVWIPETWGRDAFMTLQAISEQTKKIKLATGISNIFSRSPAQLAMAITTLNELSGNRAILGLGASGKRVVEDFHGIKFEKPAKRMQETVEIVKSLMNGEKINYSGDIFKTKDFYLNFDVKPSPIYIAALGPKMTEIANHIGDGVIFNLKPYEEIQKIKENFDKKIAMILPYGEEKELRDVIAFYIGHMGTHYHNSMKSVFGESDNVKDLWMRGKKEEAAKEVTDGMLKSVTLIEGNLDKFSVDIPIISFDLQNPTEKTIKQALDKFSTYGNN